MYWSTTKPRGPRSPWMISSLASSARDTRRTGRQAGPGRQTSLGRSKGVDGPVVGGREHGVAGNGRRCRDRRPHVATPQFAARFRVQGQEAPVGGTRSAARFAYRAEVRDEGGSCNLTRPRNLNDCRTSGSPDGAGHLPPAATNPVTARHWRPTPGVPYSLPV